ncbi:MAG: RsmE family RNA methyltransferase [Planctomycetota bacterium]
MSSSYFYCARLEPGRITLPADEARHATRSRRLRPGDELTLFDGRGNVAHARLQPPTTEENQRRTRRIPSEICVQVDKIEHIPQSTRQLSLIVAACKGHRLDYLVEKCTELGVACFYLTEFERSVVHASSQHLEKLRRTVIEACKQCGRAWLPQINAGMELPDVLPKVSAATLLIAQPADDSVTFGTWLRDNAAASDRLAAVIGPEGGLTPVEVDILRKAGGQPVTLAAHILRVETAAVCVAAINAAQDHPLSH